MLKEWSTTALAVLGVAVGAIIIGLIFATMAIFGVGWFQRSTANFRGQTSATEKTRANGDYRIAHYDEFFSLCSAVQTQEDRIKIFEKATDANAATNLQAVEAERVSLIREYNAKASASATSGQFRASKLPYQLDPNQKDTQCNF